MEKEITIMEITRDGGEGTVDTTSVWLEEKDGVISVCVLTYEGRVFKKEISPKQLEWIKDFLNS